MVFLLPVQMLGGTIQRLVRMYVAAPIRVAWYALRCIKPCYYDISESSCMVTRVPSLPVLASRLRGCLYFDVIVRQDTSVLFPANDRGVSLPSANAPVTIGTQLAYPKHHQ